MSAVLVSRPAKLRTAGVVLVVALAISGIAAVASRSKGAGTSDVLETNGGFSYSHPKEWRVYRYRYAWTFGALLSSASTQRLHDPCTTTSTAVGIETTCGRTLTRSLDADGVWITWTLRSILGAGPPVPGGSGATTPADGRVARLAGVTTPTGDCAAVNAAFEQDGEVWLTAPDQHLLMVACWGAAAGLDTPAAVARTFHSATIQ